MNANHTGDRHANTRSTGGGTWLTRRRPHGLDTIARFPHDGDGQDLSQDLAVLFTESANPILAHVLIALDGTRGPGQGKDINTRAKRSHGRGHDLAQLAHQTQTRVPTASAIRKRNIAHARKKSAGRKKRKRERRRNILLGVQALTGASMELSATPISTTKRRSSEPGSLRSGSLIRRLYPRIKSEKSLLCL